VEDVFRALSDPNRRALLDALFDRDGQTLLELSAGHDMTRFGVMKHLRVLEEAGLITTRRAGREKLHYLNPVPIRLVHDRWISKFAEPWMRTMAGLKRDLEGTENPMPRPQHVYQVYIRTTPERLWQAITDPDLTEKYYYGSRLNAESWTPGQKFTINAWGQTVAEGAVLEADPPRRLVRTVHAIYSPEAAAEAPMKHIWEIEQAGESCRLTMTLECGTDESTPFFEHAIGGIIVIVSGLKTFLETGESLQVSA